MTENNKKIRILHVDDEEDILIVVKTMLEKEGYEVVSVNKGSKALNVIKDSEKSQNPFTLLILDIMMPDMSGWELFTRIGKIKPPYKVIFLSILDMTKEKLKELDTAGALDYIKKPFDLNDFVSRVKKALNSK